MKRPEFLKFTLYVGVLALIGGIYFLAVVFLPPSSKNFENQAYLFMQMNRQQVLFSAFTFIVAGLACVLLGAAKSENPTDKESNRKS